MSIKMKELPISERPYEKLELYGPEKLSNSELLAIIIKTGTSSETAVGLAQRVLNIKKDKQKSLRFLQDISIQELIRNKRNRQDKSNANKNCMRTSKKNVNANKQQ